jgi:hypothetical protein
LVCVRFVSFNHSTSVIVFSSVIVSSDTLPPCGMVARGCWTVNT